MKLIIVNTMQHESLTKLFYCMATSDIKFNCVQVYIIF